MVVPIMSVSTRQSYGFLDTFRVDHLSSGATVWHTIIFLLVYDVIAIWRNYPFLVKRGDLYSTILLDGA